MEFDGVEEWMVRLAVGGGTDVEGSKRERKEDELLPACLLISFFCAIP